MRLLRLHVYSVTPSQTESLAGSMADSVVDLPPRRNENGSDYASVCSEPATDDDREDMLMRRTSHELASTASQSGKLEGSSGMQETWLLMELCDMGTLVVRRCNCTRRLPTHHHRTHVSGGCL